MKVAAIEVEVLDQAPHELHIFPRETRRGKAQWAIWVSPDGSAVVFIGDEQIILPKNSQTKEKYVRDHVDGNIIFVKKV